jgi:hypothetical protein
MPNVFLIKNPPHNDSLLKNELIHFLIMNPINHANFFIYTKSWDPLHKGTSYFINNLPDPGGFSSEELGNYTEEELFWKDAKYQTDRTNIQIKLSESSMLNNNPVWIVEKYYKENYFYPAGAKSSLTVDAVTGKILNESYAYKEYIEEEKGTAPQKEDNTFHYKQEEIGKPVSELKSIPEDTYQIYKGIAYNKQEWQQFRRSRPWWERLLGF